MCQWVTELRRNDPDFFWGGGGGGGGGGEDGGVLSVCVQVTLDSLFSISPLDSTPMKRGEGRVQGLD